MVRIKLPDGVTAVCHNYQWSCDDPLWLEILNLRLNDNGPSMADPYPELTEARDVISAYGGRLISANVKERKRKQVRNRVY